jgi:hypothetical protein
MKAELIRGWMEPVEVCVKIHSTDQEMIPARNASLAAMQVSASGSNIRYCQT